MKKIVAVAIVGLGGRDGEAYGRHIIALKDKSKIMYVCDINHTRLHK